MKIEPILHYFLILTPCHHSTTFLRPSVRKDLVGKSAFALVTLNHTNLRQDLHDAFKPGRIGSLVGSHGHKLLARVELTIL